MRDLPLLAAELQRVRLGFEVVAEEADQARGAVHDVDVRRVGTADCDAAVEAGPRDLERVLARLEAVAAACVLAVGRHDGSAAEDDA